MSGSRIRRGRGCWGSTLWFLPATRQARLPLHYALTAAQYLFIAHRPLSVAIA